MSSSLLSSLTDRLSGGEADPQLKAEIQAAVLARRGQSGDHREWALLCEQAGLLSLAFSEFQLALRDDPHDPVAAFHLAQHYRERGDTGRAVGLLERLLTGDPARLPWLEMYVEILMDEGAEPRAEQAIARAEQNGLSAAHAATLRRATAGQKAAAAGRGEATPAVPELAPTDADCVRFCTLFAGQEGVHARQWVRKDGEVGYSPVHEPFTPAVARNHLLGSYTVGIYPTRLDNTATFFALDLDIDKPTLTRAHGDPLFAQSLRDTLRAEGPRLLLALRELGFHALFENSGYKGRHYWVFLEQPEGTDTLHLLGRLLLAWQSPQLAPGLHLEYFPKQAKLRGKNLGNLIKLPLGIHRRTGYRSMFLDNEGRPLSEPLAALRAAVRLPREDLYAAIQKLKTLAPASHEAASVDTEKSAPPDIAEPVPGPPPPLPPAVWTEADFEADPRVRQVLGNCPTLAALKQQVDECQRLSHEEQLVLIHSLGHLEGGPQAVNYLLAKCVDVGPEKYMKDRLKGNPISCPSIRKKIPHLTRRVACNCAFEFAADRYPTPVLHLLTLPAQQQLPESAAAEPGLAKLAERYAILDRRREEIVRQWERLRSEFVEALRAQTERTIACPGGCYRLLCREGVEELVWQPDHGS